MSCVLCLVKRRVWRGVRVVLRGVVGSRDYEGCDCTDIRCVNGEIAADWTD